VAETRVDDELWDEFHRVVNMTSRELRDWLGVQGAEEETEEVPDRSDLTADDVDVMGQVVDRVHAQRRDDLEPTAGEAAWRRRLMNVGHDPLKPA
jgi:hypothetical protein